MGGILYITTLAHMTIIDTEDGLKKYPYHKQIRFTFTVAARTTLA